MIFKRRDPKPTLRAVAEFLWPRGGWTRAFHYVKHRMRRLPDSPERIARGIWGGVFTSFTPLYGFHFIIAALIARTMKGNILAALMGTFFGNPLTYVPIGIASLKTGHWILGTRMHEGEHRSFVGKFADAGADLWLQTVVKSVRFDGQRYQLSVERDGELVAVSAQNLVLASGGKSIPKMGASGFAYDIAAQFGMDIIETRPALVPLTFSDQRYAPISGVSCPSRVTANGVGFDEATLFTHRGLSGPAILQASSYWRDGESVVLNIDPEDALFAALRTARQEQGKRDITTILNGHFPARLVQHLADEMKITGRIGDQSDVALRALCDHLQNWEQVPTGSEGYRTAEVTLGGIDTDGLSSKTMEAKAQKGLYVIGEAMDVTGWLGGYNFQWAWSSGWAAGTAIAQAKD